VADGQLVLRDEPCHVAAHAFTPDGRRLAIGQHQSVVYFDLSNREEIRRWRLPARAHALAFHAAGDRLAVGYLSADIASVYEATSGNVVAELPVGAMSYHVVAWHPDGDRLAVAGSDARIQIWNVSAQRRVKTLEGHMQNVTEVMFDPAGGLLASHSWDGTLRLWDPSTGRQLLQLPFTTVSERPRISRDGRWLWAGLHGERAELLEVTRSREYRTLVSSAGVGAAAYKHVDISPDGRLLAVGMEEGAGLWDLRTGRELARLPAGTPYVFFDGGPAIDSAGHTETEFSNSLEQTESSTRNDKLCALFTSGSEGLLRWPITSDEPAGRRLRLGPPQQLSFLHRACFARTPDGRALGVATEEGGSNRIIDLETGAVRRELEPHPNGQIRALSGDGRWAASSGWHSDCVRLWNAVSGEMIHEWIVGKQTIVEFAPDSRTLIIARGDEFQFWDVKTLKPVRRLRREIGLYPGHVAFSPDGKLMALELAPAVIHLKEVASGRTVAKLEDPHGDRATWQGFTPDGTQLVVVTNYATAIHIWDLQAIRTELKEMNLDWNWPEFAPADRSSGADHEEYKIDVVLGDREKD
jgi:WD40 repeat protein